MKDLDPISFPLNGRLLIEASAGTGKTYTISSLYLRLLLGRDPSLTRPLVPSEILVLTFTIAATDELRSRIRDRVRLARDMFAGAVALDKDPFIASLVGTSADKTKDRKILSAALQTMDEATIFTIHGFCARILSEQSFATGMLFDQNLDGDRDQLLQVAAEDCFRQIIMPLPGAARDSALKLFPDPETIIKKVSGFLFRHGLQYLPDKTEAGLDLEPLKQAHQSCKALWLTENITDLLLGSDFHGGRATVKRLKPNHTAFVETYCQNDEFEPEFWKPWTSEALQRASKSSTVIPDHPIFTLIDEIHARRDEFSINLFHTITEALKSHLIDTKIQIGQLTLDDLLVEVHRAVSNTELTDSLRRQWPAAMIDEFQDTDDLQFEIFTSIYESKSASDSTLLFIGDPKQAIYNFRGADVYTYINAKQTADDSYSLGTNWRSTPVMIEAVNYLFRAPNIFGEQTPIRFEPALPAPPNTDLKLQINGTDAAPINLFVDAEASAGQYLENLMNHAAEETVRLLHLAEAGQAVIDGQPITPGQIAFLVRSGRDARAARQALANRGIRSVYVTLESVFLTDTADDLKLILEAVVDPTNESAVKSALGTRLMQCSISELDALNKDWPKLHEVITEFQEYHHLWATAEIAPMIERLMIQRRIPEKWLNQADGERQITNLRHLAELLQHRSMVAPGMRRLLKWFQREKLNANTVAAEERQLRLESDSNLVQIVTMHSSKGLEYDVVMIPYAGFGEPRGREAAPLFHVRKSHIKKSHIEKYDKEFTPAIDFSGAPESQAASRSEEFDETMRLIYVALTRAKYRCYLGLPMSKRIAETPMARLLGLTNNDFDETVAKLSALPGHLFELSDLNLTTTQYQKNRETKTLSAPKDPPSANWPWRMHSYTGLTRLLSVNDLKADAPDMNLQPRPAYGDDDKQIGITTPSELKPSRFNFPRGSKVGIVLHSFMEHLSFDASEERIAAEAEKSIAKLGLKDDEGQWKQVMIDWFKAIVTTPLGPLGLTLQSVPDRLRLDEMEFHFPINANQNLIDVLKQRRILPAHMELKVHELLGMMTGYIDLIVCHKNRFYLIDYKSNDLGNTQQDYSAPHLTEAIKHHHYNLQYLIYCVALHRYLTQRVADYKFHSHFGGVRYLFLRGMDGSEKSGVFGDRPDFELIQTLDELLSGSLPK